MEEKEKSFWCIITAPVLYSKELSDKSKILYGVISNLTKQKGYCYAHNSTLAEELGWSERTIQYSIKELEDAGFISREIEFIDKQVSGRKIYVLPQQHASPGPGSTLHGGHEAGFTHNIVTNEVIKKAYTRRSKTIDPQYEQAAAEQQVRKMARWSELTSLWKSTETTSTLTNCYNKYFKDLDEEIQESILKMLREFGTDLVHLQNEWIITFFKNKMMNGQSIKKAIERNKLNAKPKGSIKNPMPQSTGKFTKENLLAEQNKTK
jgi:DNA-binding Lrp family transcriptional regulator